MSESKRGRVRAVTLIELITVIAILGLIAGVLLVLLFPSSDRRVRLEAERLAAYLINAGAAAKMSDGPVRVVFTFEGGKYARELSKVGADLGARSWALDEGIAGTEVRKPVTLALVIMPEVGELISNQAFIVWEAERTSGGLVLLKHEEAEWSVVVDPRTGEVRSMKGRDTLPSAGDGLRKRPPGFGSTALSAGDTGMETEDLDRLAQSFKHLRPPATPGSTHRLPPSDGSQEDPSNPAAGGGGGETSAPASRTPDPGQTDDPPVEPIDDEPEAEDDDEEPDLSAVQPDAFTDASFGSDASPTGEPAEDGTRCGSFGDLDLVSVDGECNGLDLSGVAFIAESLQVPAYLPDLIETQINTALDLSLSEGNYRLFTYFDGSASMLAPDNTLRAGAWVVQEANEGNSEGTFTEAFGTTRTRAAKLLLEPAVESPAGGFQSMAVLLGPDVRFQGDAAGQMRRLQLNLYLPRRGQTCADQLAVAVAFRLEMRPDQDGLVRTAKLNLDACWSPSAVDTLARVAGGDLLQGQAVNNVLSGFGVPRCDLNLDGVLDGWSLPLTAHMKRVRLSINPQAHQNTTPNICSGR